ncbi:MAG: transporter substrate-binding domain-containing protein [Flavobacteriales bacterium]|nr:transporter substrate-binding domain-containing protein [Flavobacteriales bacterium]
MKILLSCVCVLLPFLSFSKTDTSPVLKIMGGDAYPPYEFINDKGQPDGFNVEFAKALMKQMGQDYTLELGQWSDVSEKIFNGEIDLVIGMMHSVPRISKVNYALSYLYVYHSFLVRADSGISSPVGLHGKKIVVKKGGIAEYYLSKDVVTTDVVAIPNIIQGYQMLKEGKCDAIMCDRDIINYLRGQNSNFSMFTEFPSNMPPKGYGIVVNKNDDQLLEMVDEAIATLYQNGTYDAIYDRWFNVYNQKKYSNELLMVLTIVILVAVLSLMLVYFLRRKVIKSTAEIKKHVYQTSKLYHENALVLKSLPIGMAIYDNKGNLSYINNSFAQIFGVKNINAHLKHHISIYDDPIISGEAKERIGRGEEFDMNIKYDVNIHNEKKYYSSYLQKTLYLSIRMRFVRDKNNRVEKMILIVNDETNLREREIKLQNSEMDLHLALKAGNLDVWMYNIANDKFVQMYGNDLLKNGISFQESINFIHHSSIECWKQLFSDLICQRMSEQECIIRFLNPNAKTDLYVQTRIIPVLNEKREVISLIGTYKNVTEDYLLEQELKDYNEKTELIIRSCNIIQWDYDINRKVVSTYTPGAILPGVDITMDMYLSFVHPDDKEKTKIFFEAMNKGELESFEEEIRLLLPTSKGYKNVILNGAPITDENGRIVRYTGLRRDVTDIVQLNEKMHDTQKQLNLALRAGKIEPILWDLKTDLIYITFEDIIREKHIDITSEGILLSKVLDSLSEEYREKAIEIFNSIKNGEKKEVMDEVQYAFLSADGNSQPYVYYEVHLIVDKVGMDGLPTRVVGYLQDITERKHMYDELQASKEWAEASNKLKSAFLANMSHEIRTPLNAIVGFSQLMSEAHEDEERKEYQNIIQMNSDLLLKLINDILDLSKIESGYIDLKPSDFDLSEQMESLSKSLAQRITNPKVVFTLDNPYKKCIVNTDKSRLIQVVTNFVTNAIKFTPEGSIKLKYFMVDNGIKITVSDTGIGIAEEKIQRVFQRFEKLDDFAQGTGLGMAISKAIIEANGGKIGVESTEGKGSTFWAWWPITPLEME